MLRQIVARRTVSIAAAPGWMARFLDETSEEGFRVVTLVSWALVEGADGAREIVGVVQRAATEEWAAGRLGLADEVDGFVGYSFTGLATKPAD